MAQELCHITVIKLQSSSNLMSLYGALVDLSNLKTAHCTNLICQLHRATLRYVHAFSSSSWCELFLSTTSLSSLSSQNSLYVHWLCTLYWENDYSDSAHNFRAPGEYRHLRCEELSRRRQIVQFFLSSTLLHSLSAPVLNGAVSFLASKLLASLSSCALYSLSKHFQRSNHQLDFPVIRRYSRMIVVR